MKKSCPSFTAAAIVLVSFFCSCHLMIGLEKEDLHKGENGEFCEVRQQCDGTSCFDVNALVGAIDISAGSLFTCATMSTGAVKCWGSNEYGQLGNASAENSHVPVNVVRISSGAAAISAGATHACVTMDSVGAKCWGDNMFGALGDGSTTDRSTPVDVLELSSGIMDISAGCFYTCAVTSAGTSKCWGQNSYGELGDGTLIDRRTPVDVLELFSEAGAVSAGLMHTCAVMRAGNVKCWGDNQLGQLGNGTTLASIIPVDVFGLTYVRTASCGYDFTCAVLNSGEARCWGDNWHGELGDGTNTNKTEPVQVSGLDRGAEAISAGSEHACALIAGSAKCWGSNLSGQLGNGTFQDSNVPVDVLETPEGGVLTDIAKISAGATHTCALKASGEVLCWGGNHSGQLGDGTTIENRTTPRYVLCR